MAGITIVPQKILFIQIKGTEIEMRQLQKMQNIFLIQLQKILIIIPIISTLNIQNIIITLFLWPV